MYYIKLLSLPRYESQVVSCVLSLSTDLGESLFAGNATVEINVVDQSGHERLIDPVRLEWTARSRVLKFARRVPKLVSAGSILKADVLSAPNHQGRPMGLACEIGNPHARPRRQIGSLDIAEEVGESIARHVWDSGILLTEALCGELSRPPHAEIDKHIVSLIEKTQGSRFLELGTGCGLVGLALARRIPSAHVTLTDLGDAENIAKQNISLNKLTDRVQFRKLDWHELEKASDFETPDWIVVCDCTYNSDTYRDLLGVIEEFVNRRDSKPKVLIAHKFRNEQENDFLHQITLVLQLHTTLEFEYVQQHYKMMICGFLSSP